MTDLARPRRPLPQDTLLSVVLPVYNEAKVLRELCGRVTEAARACGGDYEVLFVDDGSRDESPAILDALAAADAHVRVIHLSRNFGHQPAVQAGLAHARGDAVVLMDSDLQDDPRAIVQFVAQWRSGYDVVYAVRARRKENLLKRLLFAAFHQLMSRVASVPIPADAGIFGLVDRRVAGEIMALGENDRYFPGLRSWVGFRQQGVVVERNARYDRQPRVSLRGLFRLAKTAMFSFSTLPLSLFQVIGAVAASLFVALAGFSLGCKLFTNLAIPGWTSYVLIGSFFGALNALGISILGEYAIRIYDQVRGRPLYVIQRSVNLGQNRKLSPERPGNSRALQHGRDASGDRPYTDLAEQVLALLETGPSRRDAAAPNRAPASMAVIPLKSK